MYSGDAIISSPELASRHCFVTLEFINISVKLQLSHILLKKKKNKHVGSPDFGQFPKKIQLTLWGQRPIMCSAASPALVGKSQRRVPHSLGSHHSWPRDVRALRLSAKGSHLPAESLVSGGNLPTQGKPSQPSLTSWILQPGLEAH